MNAFLYTALAPGRICESRLISIYYIKGIFEKTHFFTLREVLRVEAPTYIKMITQRKKIKKKDTNGCVLASVYNLKSSRLAEMLLMVSFKVREIRPLMALKRWAHNIDLKEYLSAK
jgi:hypothetical protein